MKNSDGTTPSLFPESAVRFREKALRFCNPVKSCQKNPTPRQLPYLENQTPDPPPGEGGSNTVRPDARRAAYSACSSCSPLRLCVRILPSSIRAARLRSRMRDLSSSLSARPPVTSLGKFKSDALADVHAPHSGLAAVCGRMASDALALQSESEFGKSLRIRPSKIPANFLAMRGLLC